MDFLHEKQARRFYTFLVVFCVVQICMLGCSGMVQAWKLRQMLVERELGAASYLLEIGIPPSQIASAWNHTEATEEGRELLEKIGHTEHTGSYLLSLAMQASGPAILLLAVEGILFSVVLLFGAGIFLGRRESIYEKAERVVAEYAEGWFGADCLHTGENETECSRCGKECEAERGRHGKESELERSRHGKESESERSRHGKESGAERSRCGKENEAGRSRCGKENGSRCRLPEGDSGAFYHLLGRVEQLALSLRAKGETERRSKEFLQDMISNISHQLKTPLAALEMYMEILWEDAADAEVVRNFSRKSMVSLERMEQLIQSLLKMARLDTGSILFERRQCLVTELAEQASGELQERAGREDKEIVLEGKPEEVIFCDPEWTGEALGNLIKNALDHTDTGGIVRVTWKRSPVFLRLTVADNGQGIAPEDIHHIFKRFYRSKNSSDRQGAGLGLSLAKAIIEGQGGTLSAESCPGKGSAFHISFFDL